MTAATVEPKYFAYWLLLLYFLTRDLAISVTPDVISSCLYNLLNLSKLQLYFHICSLN